MLVIRNPEQGNVIPHTEQRLLVLQRTMLSQDAPYDLDVLYRDSGGVLIVQIIWMRWLH